jgi:hypothetical protein
MAEKLCVFCRHVEMNTRGCHGDYPDPATFECGRGHWSEIPHYGIGFPDDFRKVILTAATCPDYDEVKP